MVAATATVLSGLAAVSSIHEGRMASKKAEGVAKGEAVQLAEQEKKAKADRLEKIKGQRAQMGIDSTGFGSPSTTGGLVNQGEILG